MSLQRLSVIPSAGFAPQLAPLVEKAGISVNGLDRSAPLPAVDVTVKGGDT